MSYESERLERIRFVEPERVGKITQMIAVGPRASLYVLTESGEVWFEVTAKRQPIGPPKHCWRRLDAPTETDRPKEPKT